MSDQHKPLTAAEIEELKQLCANYANPACGVVDADVWKAFQALPRLLSMLQPPADASVPVEIFSAVTCNECKRAWVGYRGCLTEPLPCGHMRSQWAVGSAVVDDMVAASCVRNKSMEDVDDDDEE